MRRSPQARILKLIIVLLGMVLPAVPVFAEINIGILTDGPGARPFVPRQAMEAEILSLTRGEFDVRFPPDKQLNGNWSAAGIQAALDALLNDPDVDLVLGTQKFHRAAEYVDELHPADDLMQLTPQADFVVTTIPHTPETGGLFNAAPT